MKSKTCPKCGAAFTCGQDEATCWCAGAEYKVVRKIPAQYGDCLCPGCLKEYCAPASAASRGPDEKR